MPLLRTWECKGARFGIWHVTETVDELRSRLSANLPYDEELAQLRADTRKLEYTATRVLLAHLLGEEKCIDHHPSGKPYCPEENFHITISHTKGYVAVGICPTAEVGIDIEYQSARVMKVIDKFLSAEEQAALPSDSDTRTRHALLCWSAKETAFKVLDAEGVDFAKHLHIRPFTLNESPTLLLQETRTDRQCTYAIYGMVNKAFVCTWCVDAPLISSAK